MKQLICLFTFYFFCIYSIAQDDNSSDLENIMKTDDYYLSTTVHNIPKEIQIGDIIPDFEIGDIINYKDNTVKLKDFRGKLVILDFWATWCMPCISAFPKLDSLQKEFNDKVNFLGVTSQDKQVVMDFLIKMNNTIKIKPATITNDKLLSKLFKHIYLPHYVWIDGKGKVIAITGSEEITADNIRAAFRLGEKINLKRKIDQKLVIKNGIADKKPVFTTNYQMKDANSYTSTSLPDSVVLIRSTFSKHIGGLLPHINMPDSTTITLGNMSVYWLYRVALWNLGKQFMNESKTKIEINDSSLIKKITLSINGKDILPSGEKAEWEKNNTYCFELTVSPSLSSQKFKIMLQELNKYFGVTLGIEGNIEKRKIKCLVLTSIKNNDKLITKGGKSEIIANAFELKMTNMPITQFIKKMSYYFQLLPPIINETHYTGNVDIMLNCKLTNLNEVNSSLEKYGLKFIQEERLEEIGIITNI